MSQTHEIRHETGRSVIYIIIIYSSYDTQKLCTKIYTTQSFRRQAKSRTGLHSSDQKCIEFVQINKY